MIYPPQEQRRLSSKHSFSCSPPVCLDTSGRKPRSGFVPVRVHLSLDWVMNIKAEICAAWTEENVPERTENWWGERGAGGVMDGWVVSWKQTFMLLLLIHEKWVTLVCTSCIRYPHMASLCMMFFPFRKVPPIHSMKNPREKKFLLREIGYGGLNWVSKLVLAAKCL